MLSTKESCDTVRALQYCVLRIDALASIMGR